jgi:hypothetical protein
MNLYYLPELIDWYQANFLTNRYGDPVNLIFQRALGEFNIQHLNDTVKKTLFNRFLKYPQLTELVKSIKTSNDTHLTFWKHIQKIDQIRNTDYKKLHPEWSQLL